VALGRSVLEGVKLLAPAIALVIGLAACGGSEEGTELTITVENAWGRQSYQLRCDPPSGNVPGPADLCSLIDRNDETMLHARDLNQVCVGGLSTPYMEVKGQYRGESIDTGPSACYGHPEAEALWLSLLPPPPEAE
jgi:hypothetical protein